MAPKLQFKKSAANRAEETSERQFCTVLECLIVLVSITALLGVLTVHFESINKTHKSHVSGKLSLEDARLVDKLLARAASIPGIAADSYDKRRGMKNITNPDEDATFIRREAVKEKKKSSRSAPDHQGLAHEKWSAMLNRHDVKGGVTTGRKKKTSERGMKLHDIVLPTISAEEAFRSHPSHRVSNSSLTLVQYMSYLSRLPQCQKKPIFVTMARVQDDLYWQLIENFFYSMFRFGHLDCSVMICVSDSHCKQLCEEYDFPCYDYRHPNPDQHVMEQVAYVKLLHIGDALEAGVNILILDLDVGFLRDPLLLYEGFLENPYEYARAQMDMGFSTEKMYNTSYSHPRPNFGCLLMKSHIYNVKAFRRAWSKYQNNNNRSRSLVATDQNAIVGAIKWASWRWGYNFSYFYLGFMLDQYPRPIHFDKKVFLLDKMSLVSHTGPRFELGGEAAVEELGDAIAVHATCHEGSTKLLGLRASNAFWNSKYYNPNRRTITKPLMMLSKRSLNQELQALAYLAMRTNRSLLVPNVLIGVGGNVKGQISLSDCLSSSDKKLPNGRKMSDTPYCKELSDHKNTLADQDQSHAPLHRGEYYWPAWRSLKTDIKDLTVIEPGYYYRIEYDMQLKPPNPFIARFDMGAKHTDPHGVTSSGLEALVKILNSPKVSTQARVVLQIQDSSLGADFLGGPEDIHSWAEDSVSCWGDGVVLKTNYLPLSPPTSTEFPYGDDDLRVCKTFLHPIVGNRSCFDKCK